MTWRIRKTIKRLADQYQDVGIDIVKANRISIKDNFVKKILSKKELEEFNLLTDDNAKQRFLVSSWSSKEAIFKLNIKQLNSYSKISILHDENGKPYCLENEEIKLSISHEKKYTIAIALLVNSRSIAD